jgi:hypothetical protein
MSSFLLARREGQRHGDGPTSDQIICWKTLEQPAEAEANPPR